jgi:hypothetical protein
VIRADSETTLARRYLLGDVSEEESSAIESEYFQREQSFDLMTAAEDDLIEDYLADRLAPAERGRFERVYLSIPARRRRVDTIRRLMAAASGSIPATAQRLSRRWMALAAAVILAAAGTLWILIPSRGDRGAVAENPTAPIALPPPSAPAPPQTAPDQPAMAPPAPARVFAVSISPITVRSAAQSAGVIIPAATDVITLSLEGEAGTITASRASIRTVTGNEVWQGPTSRGNDLPRGVIARLDVPAASLPVDDYVILLFGTDAAGREQELSRHFLSLRAR